MQYNEEGIRKVSVRSPTTAAHYFSLLLKRAKMNLDRLCPPFQMKNWLRPATAFLQFATILISISPHQDVSSRLQKKLELLSLKRKSTPTLMREMHQRRCEPITDSHDSSKFSSLLSALCMILIGALFQRQTSVLIAHCDHTIHHCFQQEKRIHLLYLLFFF